MAQELENFTNFGEVTCAVGGFSSSATTIDLATSEGSKLPSGIFRLTFWNATDFAKASDDPNKEIIGVVLRVGDTLSSIVRGLEGTSAANHNTPGKTYKGTLSITAATMSLINTGISDLNKTAFRAYMGSNLTVPSGADTKLALDTEDYDTTNEFVVWNSGSISTTGRFASSKPIFIHVIVSIYHNVCTSGNAYRIRIKKNGTQVAEGRTIAPAGGDHQFMYSDVISLTTSDYLEFYAHHVDGTDRTLLSGRERTFVSGVATALGRRT